MIHMIVKLPPNPPPSPGPPPGHFYVCVCPCVHVHARTRTHIHWSVTLCHEQLREIKFFLPEHTVKSGKTTTHLRH